MLNIQNLEYSYDGQFVFHYNLEVQAGEIHHLCMPNGSGKTTLMKLIAGICNPEKGSIKLGGHEITNLSLTDRPVAWMQQEQPYFKHLTVEKTFTIAGIEQSVGEGYMKHLKSSISMNSRLSELSGGQRQAVLLGQLLHLNRPILCLDEPFSHLDYDTFCKVFSYIRTYIKFKNICVILSHHGDLP